MRIASFAASLGVALAGAALLPGAAEPRTSDLRSTDHAVSVSCGAPVGSYCAQQQTLTVTTAGRLLFLLARGSGASNCIRVDLFVDGVGRGGSILGFPALDVTPGPHTVVLRFFRSSDVCGNAVDTWTGTLRVTASVPRIPGLTLTLADRLAAARAAITPDVQRVATRKAALERELEAAQDDGHAAIRERRVVEARAYEVWKARGRARQAAARLYLATPRYRSDGEGFRQALAQVTQRIARLEAAVVVAARTGADRSPILRALKRARGDRLELERGLAARLPAGVRDLRRRWQALIDRTSDDLHALFVAQAEADRKRALADDEAHRLLAEREALDVEATELATRLRLLDVDVREVRATAGGELVFRAEGTRAEYELMRELNARLAETKRAYDAFVPLREQWRKQFYDAQRAVIAAEATVASRIEGVAYAKAGVEAAFYAWDVGSGFARGGPIGAVTVATQKLYEKGIADMVAPPGGGEGIEEEIRRAYRSALAESISGEKLESIATQRVLKETVGKAARDSLNKWFADNLFGPLKAPTSAGSPTFFRPLPTPARIREWLAAPKQMNTTAAGIRSLRKGFQLNRGVAGSMVTGFFKDVGKKYVLAALDDHERAAWRDFFEKDVIARSIYPLYRVITSFYWDIYDAHHALLHARTTLMNQNVDWRSGYRVLESKTFADDAQLELSVRVAATAPVEPPPTLAIGGKQLAPASSTRTADGTTFVYRVGARELSSGPEGLLALDLR